MRAISFSHIGVSAGHSLLCKRSYLIFDALLRRVAATDCSPNVRGMKPTIGRIVIIPSRQRRLNSCAANATRNLLAGFTRHFTPGYSQPPTRGEEVESYF